MTKPWNDVKEIIIELYKRQNKPLREVKRIMEEKYKFKASTRAYRSRFIRWNVHKYSCRRPRKNSRRKPKSSIAMSADSDLEEGTAVSPRDHSPGTSPETPPASPPMISSVYFQPTMCEDETSPEPLESPITVPKFESFDAVTSIHAGGFAHGFQFENQQYLGLQMGDGTPTELYRSDHHHTHDHIYRPDQSSTQTPRNMRGIPLPGSPTFQTCFSQLHPPTPMDYSYPLDVLKAPRA